MVFVYTWMRHILLKKGKQTKGYGELRRKQPAESWHPFCVRHCAKCFFRVVSFNPRITCETGVLPLLNTQGN